MSTEHAATRSWRPTRGSGLRNTLMTSAFAIGVCAAASPALAADPAPAPAGASAGPDAAIGEVVVTALRRSTTVQSTPIAITAMSGRDLTHIGVSDVQDVAKFVPSLRIEDNGPGAQRLTIRGIRTAGEPTVGLYYDETPVAGSVGFSSDAGGNTPSFALFDVDHIEALRGPQGTLYGASSMSGALRVILNKPKSVYEGAVEGTVSGTEHGGVNYMVNGMVNVPIVNDLLAARLVAYTEYADGYIDNIFTHRNNINTNRTTGARLMLRLTPTPKLTVDASGAFENVDAYFDGWDDRLGRYLYDSQISQPYRSRSQIYNLTARYDADVATVTAVASYQHRKSLYTPSDDTFYAQSTANPGGCALNYNVDSCSNAQLSQFYNYLSTITPTAFIVPGATQDLTGELRATSSGDHRLSWTVGLFAEDRKEHVVSEDVVASSVTLAPLQPPMVVYYRPVSDRYRQVAAYGELSYKPIDKLTLTAGLRYFHYSRTVAGSTEVPWGLFGEYAPTPTSTFGTKENGTLLKFNGEYRFNPDLMVYASASQGYRPGGANQVVGLATQLTPYRADHLWNYELGVKSSFLDRRLVVDAALFEIDWTDIQVSGFTPDDLHEFIANAGAARVRGAEFEVTARPTSALTFGANLTLLDAKLTKGESSSVIVSPGQAGDRMPFIPKVMADVNAEYRRPLGDAWSAYVRLDANYVGESFSTFGVADPDRLRIKAYALANARIGVDGDKWSAYLFINNLFDSVAINQASQIAYPHTYNVTSATPRTAGVGLRRRF